MEILLKILELSFWEKFANLHGMLAMTSLILFGAGIVLYFVVRKSGNFVGWLRASLLALFLNLLALDIAGLTIYVPYRAEGGPRTILKSSEATAWLHSVIFEHKEFLAFAPLLLTLSAFLIVNVMHKDFNNEKWAVLRRSVIFSLVASLVFVLVVAAEAVLVAKAAPLK